MKNIIKTIKFAFAISLLGMLSFSCTKNREILIPYQHDITFEDLDLGRFKFQIPNAPFKSGDEKSGTITANVKNNSDGSFSGFAISNKNWRSYPWNLSPDFAPGILTPGQIKESVDSTIFSVFTNSPNFTQTFLVGCVNDDQAFITLNKPGVIEHVLVANTTYNYLLLSYGSTYSGTLNSLTQEYSLSGTKIRNILNPNSATEMYGRFFLPGPDGNNIIRMVGEEILAKRKEGAIAADKSRSLGKTKTQVSTDSSAAANAFSKGFVKLSITGFNKNSQTGVVDYWLAIRPNVDSDNPKLNYIAPDWSKVNLSSLGEVDKISFSMSSSYDDSDGKLKVPPFFCLDGIRLKK